MELNVYNVLNHHSFGRPGSISVESVLRVIDVDAESDARLRCAEYGGAPAVSGWSSWFWRAEFQTVFLNLLAGREQRRERSRGHDFRCFVAAEIQQATLIARHEIIGVAAFRQGQQIVVVRVGRALHGRKRGYVLS